MVRVVAASRLGAGTQPFSSYSFWTSAAWRAISACRFASSGSSGRIALPVLFAPFPTPFENRFVSRRIIRMSS